MNRFAKRVTTLALAAALGLGMAGAAQAARDYRPDSQAYAGAGLTDEQRAAADKIISETVNNTGEVREALRAKRAELDAQLASPRPDADKIEKLSGEIGELRGKLLSARLAMRDKLAKQGLPPVDDFGPGPRDYGPRDGYGYGGHGYGYGYGHYGHGPRGHHGGPRGGWGGHRGGPRGCWGDCWN